LIAAAAEKPYAKMMAPFASSPQSVRHQALTDLALRAKITKFLQGEENA
jgi:hypothetical protein